MKLLAFDTSTEVLSIAVLRGDEVWQHTSAGGPKASTTLIPAVLALLAQANLKLQDLDALAFGCGPGSFTGLRTACSVVQGLAFGANRPVLPVDTLLAVAEEARVQHGVHQVVAAIDARMDEIYTGRYTWDGQQWHAHGDYVLVRPEALEVPAGWTLAGNAVAAYGERLLARTTADVVALPTAAAMLRLAPALLAAGGAVPASEALPLYIRDKVAQTTAERMAIKQAAADALAATESAKP